MLYDFKRFKVTVKFRTGEPHNGVKIAVDFLYKPCAASLYAVGASRMHKRAERLTVLTDIFSPDTAADGLEICPILPSPSFLSRQKSVPLKLRAPKTDYFCPRFVENDAGIPGVFQGGRNRISAKRTAFGVRRRLSYAYP